ncbi:sensor histidine kinase [Adhaeribacter radiodurans]|uniref:histidine kinase n=1 Tax=Adhaeribacter radiodurans TaxID=2745197 RepID=A0A7L7L8P4_9BACT|nr:7TM-DISM domain-containing protein [Adhaeribacter radiodurans]QMU29094.1 hypothetical protein HUW48_14040 [Adhaeribacter radiodurans]
MGFLIKKCLVLIGVILYTTSLGWAQDTLSLSDTNQQSYSFLPGHVELLRDFTQRLTLKEVLNHSGFIINNQKSIKEGPGATYWLRFTIRNQDAWRNQWYLNFSSNDIFRIFIYTVSPSGQVLSADTLGNSYPYAKRRIHVVNFNHPFSLHPKEVKTFYVYLDHHLQMLDTEMNVINIHQGYKFLELYTFIHGITIGGSLIYLLGSLVLVSVYRRIINMYFSFYVLGAVLYLVGSTGFGFWLLWPNIPFFQDASPYIGFTLILVGYSGLFRIFFRLEANYPKSNYLFIAFTSFFVLLAIGFMAWPYLVLLHEKAYYWLYIVEAITCMACFFISFGLGIKIYWETCNKTYLWFLSVFILLICTCLIVLLMELTPISIENYIKSGLIIVTVFYETTVLSLLLIRRTYLERIYYQEQIISERERIVEDLHDEVISIIAGVRISFGILSRKLTDTALQNTLQTLDKKISKVIDQIRELSRDLKSDSNHLSTLAAELYRFANDQFEMSGIHLHFTFHKSAQPISLPLVVRRNLKGFLKEAIHNCRKYAQAQNCWIKLEHSGNVLHCLIKDDGQGFNHEEGMLHPIGEGNGLRNFKKRAQKMQADYTLITQSNQGVEIRLTINLLQFNKLDLAMAEIP